MAHQMAQEVMAPFGAPIQLSYGVTNGAGSSSIGTVAAMATALLASF